MYLRKTFLALAGHIIAGSLLLSGATVQTTYLYPNSGTTYDGPVNSVVGPGVELLNFAGYLDIDFSATNILMTTTRGGGPNAVPFDGLRFFDVLSTMPAITGVTLNPSSTYAGLTQAGVSFDADNIRVNLAGLTAQRGQTISLDIAQVPEPATYGLVGLALAAAALYRKRAR